MALLLGLPYVALAGQPVPVVNALAGGTESEPEQTEPEGLLPALTVDSCQDRISSSLSQVYDDSYRLPEEISVLSWNIYKGQREALLDDLTLLSHEADMVLLQEAMLDKRYLGLKPFWRFAPGYKVRDLDSGVLTLSQWPAAVHCHFTHVEPWLRTPKATNLVTYLLADGQQLLAVNMHAINFALGLRDYRAQLADAVEIMTNHEGPIIFAGDLNSWSESRRDLVRSLLQPLGLHEASFATDNRTRTFGLALDQLWLRGVGVNDARVPLYTSSDHNPLFVDLTFVTDRDLVHAP